jgi:hypothetical protein
VVGHLIPAWSYSTWSAFQKCKYKVYLEKVEKREQLVREVGGAKEHPLDRGTRVHDAAEIFVKGEVEMIQELKGFAPEFLHLRDLYDAGLVELEGDWAFKSDWKPTAWMSKDAWLRAKLDALVIYGTEAVAIDYKTGKSWGNEVAHATQGQLYQLLTFLKHPELTSVSVEFWYTDQNEITKSHFTREKGMRFFNTWQQRGDSVTKETEFRANPSDHACKWCPFGRNVGTGSCEYKI